MESCTWAILSPVLFWISLGLLIYRCAWGYQRIKRYSLKRDNRRDQISEDDPPLIRLRRLLLLQRKLRSTDRRMKIARRINKSQKKEANRHLNLSWMEYILERYDIAMNFIWNASFFIANAVLACPTSLYSFYFDTPKVVRIFPRKRSKLKPIQLVRIKKSTISRILTFFSENSWIFVSENAYFLSLKVSYYVNLVWAYSYLFISSVILTFTIINEEHEEFLLIFGGLDTKGDVDHKNCFCSACVSPIHPAESPSLTVDTDDDEILEKDSTEKLRTDCTSWCCREKQPSYCGSCSSDLEEMHIFCIGPDDKTATIRTRSDESIRDVKEKVSEVYFRKGISMKEFDLRYGSKFLEDNQSCSFYNIQKEATLFCSFPLRGGMKRSGGNDCGSNSARDATIADEFYSFISDANTYVNTEDSSSKKKTY